MSTDMPNDDRQRLCNVCNGPIAYGERHHQCGTVVMKFERDIDRLRAENERLREAVNLCKQWFEDDEHQSIAQIIETDDMWKARGQQGWNTQFITMIRAIAAALKEDV